MRHSIVSARTEGLSQDVLQVWSGHLETSRQQIGSAVSTRTHWRQPALTRPPSITSLRRLAMLTPERQIVGVVVDAVNELMDIDPADVEPAPAFGARIRTDFIAGMGKVRGMFVILLDVDRVLGLDEAAALMGSTRHSTELLSA